MIPVFIKTHKVISGFALLVLAGAGYFGYVKFGKEEAGTRYVLSEAKRGTIIVSTSGSGQVSSQNQVDIKPKVSGDILTLHAVNGREVKAGDILVQLDSREAQKAVRDAEVGLETARISLEKLKQPADTLTLLQNRNALLQAEEAKQQSTDDLKKAYDDAFTDVSDAFLDLPAVMTGLEDILYKNTVNANQWNVDAYVDAVRAYDERILAYKNDALTAQKNSRHKFDANLQNYKAVSRSSDTAIIEALLKQTYETTEALSEAVKITSNLIDFAVDILTTRNLKLPTQAVGHKSNLAGYTGALNGHIQALLARTQTIQSSKDAMVNADRSIAEKIELLAKLDAGADALDIRSSELSMQQRQNALYDAREKLADYKVRAPFNGIVVKVGVKKGDPVSSATVLCVLMARQKLAEIMLNEVDIAKIKPGQKATLTFDAVEGLQSAGEVFDVDGVGTVSQGVVNYAVKITFAGEDERIKPGMSVSAAIITQAKQQVLTVQSSAVKSQAGAQYVEVFSVPGATEQAGNAVEGIFSNVPPERVVVETGIANDTETEIVSGLTEGERIVVRTVSAASASAAPQQQSLFRVPGTGGGGGAFRAR